MAAAAAARVIRVDVVSDTICPWCFIGKRRLERAIKDVSARLPVRFEVVWRPFLLDPTLPAEGVDKMERYISKFGAARMAQMLPYMAAVGEAEGITFDYGGKVAATHESHRVLERALELGGAALQDKVVEALFHFYFENKGNIGDRAGLVSAAASAGMDATALTAYLDSEAGHKEVNDAIRAWASKYRISGVPFFIFDGKHSLSGAQDPATFVEALESVAGAS